MQVGTLNSVSYSTSVVHVKVSIQRITNTSLTITTVTPAICKQQDGQGNAVEYMRNVYIYSIIVTVWYDFIPFDGDLISPTTIQRT
jgi:hypothetical protein